MLVSRQIPKCLVRRPLHWRRSSLPAKVAALGLAWWVGVGAPAHASFLFDDFLDPFLDGLGTDYSSWNFTSTSTLGTYPFYAPNGLPNYPTSAAPFGDFTTASAAGVANPGGTLWASQNPMAFWDSRNPTITQTGTTSAFITSSGGIYSFTAPTSFALKDSTSYNLGTVIFQFQTVGTQVDTSSIELQYTNATGTHLLAPNESIAEYSGSTSAFGGLSNRMAMQWSLAGLNITSFQILFTASNSSMSLQQALIDTAPTYTTVVPSSGKWISGNGNWSSTAAWALNATNGNRLPQEDANSTFANTSNATVTLDANHAVGQLIFDTPASTTISAPGGFTLTSNTGVTTTAQSTGTYTINSAFALNALNLFHINAGTVMLNGPVSGAYGLAKDGAGTLILGTNNSFTGDLDMQGGTLRLNGTNIYTGATNVLFGTLIVAANAGTTGALGSSAATIVLGADSSTFANVGGSSAAILIDGDHTISRTISFTNGTFQQTLGAQNTTNGATFSGGIALSTASNIVLSAANSTDKVTFTAGLSGGTGTVTINGQGTVSFSGAGKTYAYANATNIASGKLRIENGSSFTGNGNMTVSAGAQVIVSGSLSGSGALINNGGLIGGAGTISRALTFDTGDILSPGDGLGTLNTIGENWAGGGKLRLEIANVSSGMGVGWDSVNIAGALNLSATSASPFTLELDSLTSGGVPGLLSGFNPNTSYTWQFLTASGAITGFNSSEFTVNTGSFQNTLNGALSVGLTSDSHGLALNYVPVPEPSAVALAFAGLIGLANRRRRRQ